VSGTNKLSLAGVITRNKCAVKLVHFDFRYVLVRFVWAVVDRPPLSTGIPE
jgi:hypothetical protein